MSDTYTLEQKQADNKTVLGFWIYLMTDCIIFASLFATFIILRNNTFGGPSGQDLFELPFILTETLLLLTSSFTCGLGIIAAFRKDRFQTVLWFSVTFLLGAAFLGMELYEFYHLIHDGNSWQRSGFLTAFFTLVGTHGLHIFIGLLWIIVLLLQVIKRGLTRHTTRRLLLLSLFWHFLDVIWIFIFTIVYLMGVI